LHNFTEILFVLQSPEITELSKQIKEKLKEVDAFGIFAAFYGYSFTHIFGFLLAVPFFGY